jgi:hypothetical protein
MAEILITTEQPTIHAVEKCDDPVVRGLMYQFESLGENCELGLVQRKYGAEPLSLLRWTSVHPFALVKLLKTQFEGVGDPDQMTMNEAPWGEIFLSYNRFGMNFHTFRNKISENREIWFAQECSRLAFLRDKLLEDISEGDKIFVYKMQAGLSDDVLGHMRDIAEQAGVKKLLFVLPQSDQRKAGEVLPREKGCAIGYISELGPSDGVWNIPFGEWVQVCQGARDIFGNPGDAATGDV